MSSLMGSVFSFCPFSIVVNIKTEKNRFFLRHSSFVVLYYPTIHAKYSIELKERR